MYGEFVAREGVAQVGNLANFSVIIFVTYVMWNNFKYNYQIRVKTT